MSQYGFYFNADTCTSCRTCVAACKDKNALPVGTKYRKVIDYAHGDWEVSDKGVCTPRDVYVYSVSVSCMHCASPACIEACPTGAMVKRDDGVVFVDQAACIGCGSCALACPYDAPRLDEEAGVMGKCDMCREYIDAGGNPACVDACRTRSLLFGDLEELRSLYGNGSDIVPLADSSVTGPSFVVTPNRAAKGANADDGVVTNLPEELS